MKKISMMICFGLIVLALVSGQAICHDVLIPKSLNEAVLFELSGLKALDYIVSLCNFDRSGASQGLYDAQVWVSSRLKEWGFKDVVLESFPADGKTLYL